GAEPALKIGLVDGVVKQEKLIEGAIAVLRQAITGDLDWRAKRLGIMYIIVAIVMLLRGFADAIMMRSQQALASAGEAGFLPP
ncbi:hypothetical protein MJN76_35195, partial [Salmonella enterica subsp. enterica serovar Anatum]|nr:hypothetical protein [Salmonella enterica subsp. enterica serovar Anatum]